MMKNIFRFIFLVLVCLKLSYTQKIANKKLYENNAFSYQDFIKIIKGRDNIPIVRQIIKKHTRFKYVDEYIIQEDNMKIGKHSLSYIACGISFDGYLTTQNNKWIDPFNYVYSYMKWDKRKILAINNMSINTFKDEKKNNTHSFISFIDNAISVYADSLEYLFICGIMPLANSTHVNKTIYIFSLANDTIKQLSIIEMKDENPFIDNDFQPIVAGNNNNLQLLYFEYKEKYDYYTVKKIYDSVGKWALNRQDSIQFYTNHTDSVYIKKWSW